MLLVNNVGGGACLSLAPFAHLDDAAWEDAWATNLMSAVRTTRAALPLLAINGGAIVNVSSIGARKPDGPPLAYNVAEAVVAGAPAHVGMLTGRLSEPGEVADLICFLLSDRAANITGANYFIDGGATRSA
ncbi:MAG: SDR family oxidoreductase [Propioniciclava sp.]|uniref:SDR family oxidoreductase n=1 Tax=Propioniciclava sp. TaxID=2038686 RepID=UPI0039E2DFA6